MAEAIINIRRVLDTVRSNRNIDIISVSGDYGARFINAVIAVDGKPVKIDPGCAVTINARRIDKASKAFVGTANEDGTVTVPITEWMLEIPHSQITATVTIAGADSKLSTAEFYINVQDTPHKSEVISEDDPNYDVLLQVLAGEAARNAAEAERERRYNETFGQIDYLDKRIINLEKGYSDDLFVTGSTDSAGNTAVPANALPYAEVKTLAGGYTYTGVKIYIKKPMRIESCKGAEKKTLDVTLDLSEIPSTMTVEKLADGSIKFNGYTNDYGAGAGTCKFGTINLSAGSYGISYKVVSGTVQNPEGVFAVNDRFMNTIVTQNTVINISKDTSFDLFVLYDAVYGGGFKDCVVRFEKQEGAWSGDSNMGQFVTVFTAFASLEIPEEIRNIDGYGLHDNYLDFENKQLVLIRKLNADSTAMPKLPTPERVDVSEYLGDDNLIEVAPNGVIRVIQDTGAQMTANREVVFMLKGV